jgi:hypothetical protein
MFRLVLNHFSSFVCPFTPLSRRVNQQSKKQDFEVRHDLLLYEMTNEGKYRQLSVVIN